MRKTGFFEMNSSQRNGTVILILIMLIVAIIPPILDTYFTHKPVFDLNKQKEIEQFFANLKDDQPSKKSYLSSKFEGKKALKLFMFNPNLIDVTEWEKLGFSEKQANVILKYKNTRGGFKIKNDLKKIFVINEAKFNELSPFIDLPEELNLKSKQENSIEKKEFPKPFITKTLHEIDINKADTAIFASLPGIGAVLSERIVKYREKLGGFIQKEQIGEVFGISPELLQKLESYLKCQSFNTLKISLNFSTMSEMAKHPYIGYQKAKMIVEFRSKNGAFLNRDILVKTGLFSKDEFNKIDLYLVLNR